MNKIFGKFGRGKSTYGKRIIQCQLANDSFWLSKKRLVFMNMEETF